MDHSRTNVPEQRHEAMRAAAMRPVVGRGADPGRAASGGLELPGGENHDAGLPIVAMGDNGTHEPIPGEHDATTLTHRQAGAMGGAFNGADNVEGDATVPMDRRTLREHVREGGGLDAERRFDKQGGR